MISKKDNIKQYYDNYTYKQVNNLLLDENLNPTLAIFYDFIKAINKQIISMQLDNINNTLYLCTLLKNKKLYFKTINNRLCIQKINAKNWCNDNNIPYYN